MDGIERFGEDEMILSELFSFEAYMGNLEEAKEYGERYLEVAEESERKDEVKKAMKEIDFKLDNRDAIYEAYDFITLGEPDKALPIIDKFLSENPSIWNGYFLKGWALRIRKDYKEARECFLACLKLVEGNSEIYNELSICELELGNRELAKIYLETACDMDESNLTTTTNLAFLFLEDGEYDEAREYLEKARYLAKDDKFVKGLIEAYEKATGEKVGDIIHEEYVKNVEGDKSDLPNPNFQDDFRKFALSVEEELPFDEEEDEESSCHCGRHCHDDECHHDENCSCHKGEGDGCKCHH